MDSGWIIGALALMTIGGTLALAVFHFGFHLKDPKNLEAAKRVVEDRESATSKMSADGAQRRTLRQRLDDAPGISDRIGRSAGLGPWDAINTKWSDWRAVLGDVPRRSEQSD